MINHNQQEPSIWRSRLKALGYLACGYLMFAAFYGVVLIASRLASIASKELPKVVESITKPAPPAVYEIRAVGHGVVEVREIKQH